MANNFVRCNQLGKWDFYLRTFSLLITVDVETTHVHSVFVPSEICYERRIFMNEFCFFASFVFIFFFFLTDLNNIYIGLKFDMLLTLSSWFWD